ncbi:hypothetical protein OGAPHI_007405 [Ogataea philodendri]|uniref:Uncharacterized protein n=1 Tax=Ogataea philodendri TaxID=1378263 RepID=A0A9P8SZS7_9ASCO|nr:uncharacterized protein OGAPHI_007405 [Ogataea philodendri]KAH3660200.1 hypothetical protein OGAPHI_007405 [Ogataea philodendri]
MGGPPLDRSLAATSLPDFQEPASISWGNESSYFVPVTSSLSFTSDKMWSSSTMVEDLHSTMRSSSGVYSGMVELRPCLIEKSIPCFSFDSFTFNTPKSTNRPPLRLWKVTTLADSGALSPYFSCASWILLCRYQESPIHLPSTLIRPSVGQIGLSPSMRHFHRTGRSIVLSVDLVLTKSTKLPGRASSPKMVLFSTRVVPNLLRSLRRPSNPEIGFVSDTCRPSLSSWADSLASLAPLTTKLSFVGKDDLIVETTKSTVSDSLDRSTSKLVSLLSNSSVLVDELVSRTDSIESKYSVETAIKQQVLESNIYR